MDTLIACPTHAISLSLNSNLIMKAKFIRTLLVMSALTAVGHSQTINWGSAAFSQLQNSTGSQLTNPPYVFQLGSFASGFVPTELNTASWQANWKTFDQANYTYTSSYGYFTSSASMTDQGYSTSAFATSSYNFSNQTAYLWARDTTGDGFNEAGEFVLTRAASWTFPTAVTGCCDSVLPVEWAVSDVISNNTCLDTSVPLLTTNTATNSGVTYRSGSVFEWDLYSNTTAGRGTNFDGVDVIGDLTVNDGAIIKIVIHDAVNFTGEFWDSTQTWANLFQVSADSTATFNWTQAVQVFLPGSCTPYDVSNQGQFSMSGSSLIWSPVPEPTGVVVGLLLAAGLLRRRR